MYSFCAFFKSSALIWVIILCVTVLLALPLQMHEYYRVAAADFSIIGRSDLAVWFFLFTCVIALVGYVSVIALRASPQRSGLVEAHSARPTAEKIAASFAIVLPFLGLLAGLILANTGTQFSQGDVQAIDLIDKAFRQGVRDQIGAPTDAHVDGEILVGFSIWLGYMAWIAVALGASLLLIVNIWPIRVVAERIIDLIESKSAIAAFICAAVYLAMSLMIFMDIGNIGLKIGTFGFLSLSFGLFFGLIASLACLSRRMQVPLCFAFLAWPFAIAIFGWGDNDEIPGWKADPGVRSESNSERSIATYLEARLNVGSGTTESIQKPVPIYVVAAPGGGLYASYFVSTVLTYATQAVPKFRQHLFAISAVSGGALGSTLYSALYQNNDACQGYISADDTSRIRPPDKELSRLFYLSQFHSYDFLAPVTGALLFLDSTQAYIPAPVPRFDRARALERSIQDAWKMSKAEANAANEAIGSNDVITDKRVVPMNLKTEAGAPFDCPIGSLFHPNSPGPAILFNVTEVGTGQQRVIAPFAIANGYAPSATSGVKLATAAVLSARFPYFTPPGWFRVSREFGTERVYIVDGSYYENSGVATAQTVVRALKALRGNDGRKFAIRLIVLVGPYGENAAKETYLTELLSPIRALSRSRIARGQNYVDEVRLDMPACEPSALQTAQDCQLIVGIRDMLYPLPLGWDMSELSRLVIEAQDGQFDECARDKNSGVVNAACLVGFLRQDLN